MSNVFNNLLEFFGLNVCPANLGEFIPWFLSVMVSITLVLYIFSFISQMMRGMFK